MPETAAVRGERQSLLLRPAAEADRARVAKLLSSEQHLDTTFEPGVTWVAEDEGAIVATARVRAIPGGSEIAGVVVSRERRGEGIGEKLAGRLLQPVGRPVYALALAPGFFARLGFVEVPSERLPEVLQEKARTTCASVGFVPMVLA